MAWSIPWNVIASRMSGDIGGYTIYTDRYGRPTVFEKDTPTKPPSARQVFRRARFKEAQANWKALSDADKRSLETACKLLSMPLTGQNLWISVSMRHDLTPYETVQRQSGIPLPPPVFV